MTIDILAVWVQVHPYLQLILLWCGVGLVIADSGWPDESWGDREGFAAFTILCWPVGLIATIADCTTGHASYPRNLRWWLAGQRRSAGR